MSWYLRTLTSTDATPYEQLEDATAQVRKTVKLHARKIARRTPEGKIELREPDGALFNTIWIEDEDGCLVPYDL